MRKQSDSEGESQQHEQQQRVIIPEGVDRSKSWREHLELCLLETGSDSAGADKGGQQREGRMNSRLVESKLQEEQVPGEDEEEENERPDSTSGAY